MPEALLAGLFGLLIGSFLNVCIHRWPRDLSVVRPRSFCPACEKPVAWFDNLPIVSYALLRGKCRHCRAAIDWRYPLVEALTAAAFFWFVWHLGPTIAAAKYCVFSAILIALTFADLETRLLPDELTIGGAVIGVVFAFFTPVIDSSVHLMAALAGFSPGPRTLSVGESLFAAIVPAGILWLTGYLFEKIRHREGLGFGDVKMMAMMGAFLGTRASLFALVAGSLLGSIVGLAYIWITRKKASEYELPFGVFLGIGGMLAITVGGRMVDWYAGKL